MKSVYSAARTGNLNKADYIKWRVNFKSSALNCGLRTFQASFSSFLELGISVKMKLVLNLRKYLFLVAIIIKY